MTDKIKLLIVSETVLVSNMLASLLEDEPGIEVIDTETNIDNILQHKMNYDVILASASLPEQGAMSLTRSVSENDPNTKIVLVGLTETKSQILDYVEAGADGYVLQQNTFDELIERVKKAASGKAVVSPKIAGAMADRLNEWASLFSDVEAVLDNPVDLTPREHEVLELIGDGMTNREIADQLYIEIGTVKNHVHNILQKLDVSNRKKAAAYLALINKGQK
jgi:DNA-binding NarL/FixJ family response regulator